MNRSVENPVLSAEVLAYLETQPPRRPFWEQDIAEVREDSRQTCLAGGGPPEAVAFVEDVVAGGVPARLYLPLGDETDVLVWIHGGGWMFGDLDGYEALSRALANRAGSAVLSVDYRLAPEHRYPAAIDDVWAATEWAHENFDVVAVGGDSAGGNLAAAVALRARDKGLGLALQLLVYPVLDATVGTPFQEEFGHRYADFAGQSDYGGDSQEALGRVWAEYVPDPGRRFERDASPMSAESLRGVAPALFITAEHDILRGESEAYAERLEAEGVRTEAHNYDGQVHGFFNLLSPMSDARDAVGRAATGLREAFRAQT